MAVLFGALAESKPQPDPAVQPLLDGTMSFDVVVSTRQKSFILTYAFKLELCKLKDKMLQEVENSTLGQGYL